MNNLGFIRSGSDVYSYQIGERPMALEASHAEQAHAAVTPLRINNLSVYPFGPDNLEPNTEKDLIGANRLIPELIDKQVRMLYGKGPVLYRSEVDEEGNVLRRYVEDKDISEWLDSWQQNGLQDSFKTYINKCCRSYYYTEGIFSKVRLSVGMGRLGSRPVVGLEHLSETRCRFATSRDLSGLTDFEDRDFELVMVGNWVDARKDGYKVYPRFSPARPLAHPASVSYSKNPSFGEEVYAFNVFFRGIKEWIKGSNLTPCYINDYLENAMSARLHIIIPEAWVISKKNMLEAMCERNEELRAADKPMQKIKMGEDEYLDVKNIYSESILSEYINLELKKFTRFLSGRGRNQGKVYATRGYTNDKGETESWKIEEIPQKYKEYIEAITKYDERADAVILSSKGLDSSISNVSKDGVISKSGSDAYYNYMMYLNQLSIPEEVVCTDINQAIRINFPDKYRSGLRVGFYRPVIDKQQNVTPENRMSNQPEL